MYVRVYTFLTPPPRLRDEIGEGTRFRRSPTGRGKDAMETTNIFTGIASML